MDVKREEDADMSETWLVPVTGVEAVSDELGVGRDSGTGNEFCCWDSVFGTWYVAGTRRDSISGLVSKFWS